MTQQIVRLWLHRWIVVAVLFANTRTHGFVLQHSTQLSFVKRSHSFSFTTPISTTSKVCLSKRSNDHDTSLVVDYNDDAFGLVFLCGSFVAQDIVFSTTFLIGSAMAALLVKQGKLSFSNRIPAIIAGLSLLVASLPTVALQSTSLIASKTDSAWQVELVACSISIIYGFIVSPMLSRKEDQ